MPDKEFVLEWIRYAENDLISARILFDNSWPRQTGNTACQQCAEKALKAFLVANDIDPPKIHDLDKLVKLCMDIEGGFVEIEIECASLTRYGVVSRYPGELPVDEIIAKALIKRAQKVYDFCVAKTNALSPANQSGMLN